LDENTVVDITKAIPTSVDEVNQIWVQVQDIATAWGLKVIAAIAIFIIGRWIAMLVRRVVRVWTKTADYWAVKCDMTETTKNRFDAEGIAIPFPQRGIHIVSVGAAA
jgi:Mechanosensitive ion channel, conserved TM helix